MQAMEISRTALDVEWRRLEITAANLANINSARSGQAPFYRERTLVSGPRAMFDTYLKGSATSAGISVGGLAGVDIYGVQESDAPPRLAHEPANPLADANGMVAYPNVDHAGQMLLMVKASRAYEANMVALNSARQMYAKALELGEALMAVPIAPVLPVPGGIDSVAALRGPLLEPGQAGGFSRLLNEGPQGVSNEVLNADRLVRDFAIDDSMPVHQVTYALEQAHLSLNLMMQVRNRLVEAYQQVMNMQL